MLLENPNESRAYTRYGPRTLSKSWRLESPFRRTTKLIKVHGASVNPVDWRLMEGAPNVFRVLFQLRKPTPAEKWS